MANSEEKILADHCDRQSWKEVAHHCDAKEVATESVCLFLCTIYISKI
jgi:hypothetical protein